MDDLTKNGSCQLMAGNKKIFIVDVEEVQSIDFVNLTTKRVVLKPGFRFAQIQADSIESDVEISDGCFSHQIDCVFFGVKNKYDRLFSDMARRRWIVKIVDNSNGIWLSGTKEEPLRFSFRHVSQPKPDGTHHYELSFSRLMTEPQCGAAE